MNFYIILIAIVAGFGFVVFWMSKKMAELKDSGKDDRSMMMLQQQLSQLSQVIDQKLDRTNQMTQNQLRDSVGFLRNLTKENQENLHRINEQSRQSIQSVAKEVKEVTEKLAKLDETNRKVVDFSSQLKNLQDILRNPKQRGVLGEYYLEETMKNVLPPNAYQMQYKFKDSSIVDAVIILDNKKKLIPIDSKFSLENYEQLLGCNDPERRKIIEVQFKNDLKRRIDETSKYIKPAEKTVDFAFMFIPSESIYYDLLVNKVGTSQISSRDLIEYAFKEKHVIIVSPTSFLAYLQTVLHGLRALEIEESAKNIRKNMEKWHRHLQNYGELVGKMGSSLSTTVNHFNNASKELEKIDKDAARITEGEQKIEAMRLEKPEQE